MADFTVRTGHDTGVAEANPAKNYATGRFPAVRDGDELRVLLWMPIALAQVRGKTILSAILSCAVRDNWINQTISARALASDWRVAKVNWNNKPALTGATVTSAATGALSDGDRFDLDVTDLVQAIADGQANYGWQITTSQSTARSTFRGFDSGFSSWVLTVEVSDELAEPSQLSPEGVIGTNLWTLSFDDFDDLSQVQVQVDAAASAATPDYDSGWVSTTEPTLDLAELMANLLPDSQGDAGTFANDIDGWLASNAVLARVTTPTQTGAGAMRMTASALGDMFAASGNGSADVMVPVTPGQTYHFEAYSRAATTTRSTRVEIQWYDAALASLSTTLGTASANSSAAYGLREVTAEAPAGAAYARPRLYVIGAAAGEQHYWDTVKPNIGSSNYAGPADGGTTFWRVRAKTLNGSISPWSDWVEVDRDDKPTIVDDTGTDLWDPTFTQQAHLSPAGDSSTRWQLIITAADDPTDIRYDSGDDVEGAELNHQVPLRWRGRKVFTADGDYRRVIKAWDRTDRVPSPGDLPFVRQIDTVTLDVDGTVTAPTLTVTIAEPAGEIPRPRLHIERGAAPDRFIVRRDGEYLETFDGDEFLVVTGEWEWDDEGADPNVEHTYTVRAVTDIGGGDIRQSGNSSVETINYELTGTWLRSDLGDLLLYGPYPEAEYVDKRQTFVRPYHDEDVDIVTAAGSLKGSGVGTVDRRHAAAGTLDLSETLELLEAMRKLPPTAEIRLVYATSNVWINLRSFSWAPDNGGGDPAKGWIKSNPKYTVKYGFQQIDPRD